MNIACSICTDFLVPQSDCFSTQCGHIFHHHCLIQWIERSRTCPQCRYKTTEKTIHRVFLHESNTSVTESAASLQNKLSSLEIHCQKIKEKNETFKKRNQLLRQEIQTLEDKTSLNESTMSALKEQMLYYKNKCKNQEKLEEEIVRLKERIQTMEDLETVITGSNEQVKDMLKHNRDPQSLHILIVTLKNELVGLEKKKKLAVQRMKEAQADAASCRKGLRDAQLENATYKQQLQSAKGLESERLYLKRQLRKMKEGAAAAAEGTASGDVSQRLERVIFESPAPMKRKSNADDVSSADVTLLGDEASTATNSISSLKARTESKDSPYLAIKSSNVFSRSSDIPRKETVLGNNFNNQPGKLSIFNKNLQRSKGFELKPHNAERAAEVSFDGLGGHSKEDLYPTPVKLFKKHKSTSASSGILSSNKFKKLAPHSKNQTLKGFLSDSIGSCSNSSGSSRNSDKMIILD